MPELIEPDVRVRRGTFRDAYAIPADNRDKRNQWPRLMDCCITTCASDDPDYFENPKAGEFAVVDVVTKEKGWFEMPYGCTPDVVTDLVQSHFGAPAFRVGPRLWFV